MILQEVLNAVQEADIATQLTDLFAGELPLDVTDCIAAMYAISPDPHKTFDVYEQTIDFWARHRSSTTGYNKLRLIQDLFHKKYAYNLGDYHIYFSNSLGVIEDMDRDSERRKLYKLSIRFIYRT